MGKYVSSTKGILDYIIRICIFYICLRNCYKNILTSSIFLIRDTFCVKSASNDDF